MTAIRYSKFNAAVWHEGYPQPGDPSLAERAEGLSSTLKAKRSTSGRPKGLPVDREELIKLRAGRTKSHFAQLIGISADKLAKRSAASPVLTIDKARGKAPSFPESRMDDKFDEAVSSSPSTVSPLPSQPITDDAARPVESIPSPAEAQKPTKKGDIALLKKADGSFYSSVDFSTAESYADISPRRRQQLMPDVLKVVGQGQNRRITVESLLAYCPPKEDAK